MKELIEALTIMQKRGEVSFPTHCEHDVMYVYPADMDFTEDELKRLEELNFDVTEDGDGFESFFFGSC